MNWDNNSRNSTDLKRKSRNEIRCTGERERVGYPKGEQKSVNQKKLP